MEPEKKPAPHILIIDDEIDFATALKTFLTNHGYRVLIAYDSTMGMSLARKGDIAAIVLDLGIPGGGGFFVLENLRKLPKTAGIPIIISTANIGECVREKTAAAGATDFIAKPYDLEMLLEKIRKILP